MINRIKKTLKKAIKELESTSVLSQNVQNDVLATAILANEQVLKQVFENCTDIVFRPIIVHGQTIILLIYVDGLVDSKVLDQVVLKPMMFEGMPNQLEKVDSYGKIIQGHLVALSQVKAVSKVSLVVEGVLKGNLAVLTNGESQALLADLKGFEKRSVEEPAAEVSVRGPRDGFTETLRINTSLVRRRIRSQRLKMESFSIGDLTRTDIVIAYIEGIAYFLLMVLKRHLCTRSKCLYSHNLNLQSEYYMCSKQKRRVLK